MFPFRTVVMLALCVVPSLVCGHITPTGPAVGTEIRGGEERVFEWNFDKEELDGNPFAHERFRCDLMWGKEVSRTRVSLGSSLIIRAALGRTTRTEPEHV